MAVRGGKQRELINLESLQSQHGPLKQQLFGAQDLVPFPDFLQGNLDESSLHLGVHSDSSAQAADA